MSLLTWPIGGSTGPWCSSAWVTRGLVLRHVYIIPKRYVAEATEGIVDLTIDKQGVEGLEITGTPARVELPDEFRRIEGIENSAPDPSDLRDEALLRR